jgi:hypothetical protein
MCKNLLFAFLMALLLCPAKSVAEDFKPISPEELQMKEVAGAPGAHAVILEYSDYQDDTDSWEDEYYRIKIFDEEGKKHADVELTFLRDSTSINNIKARVVQPDGKVLPFNGKVFEKTIIKGRGLKFQAKAFSLPDVRPGSIIEYKFRRSWDRMRLVNSRWSVQRDLFMKKASFVLAPYTQTGSYTMSFGLPAGKQVERKNGKLVLTLENMPAFEEERFAPPEEQLKPRVEIIYSNSVTDKVDEYWKNIGKRFSENVEDYIGNRKAIAAAVQETVAPTDDSEKKLRKIYARVQQLRNLSWEREKTAEEEKREKLKESNNVEDVWKRGYGDRVDLNRLFVALARAAGFEANVVLVSRRDSVFFDKNIMNFRQFNSEAAYVKAGDKEYYLDPGIPYCRFGLLPWSKTGVVGMRLGKNGGTFVQTPPPDISTAVTKRLANLRYEDGAFKGVVQILYDGLEALERRLSYIQEDEKEFNDDLEEELKGDLPRNSTVKLKRIENARSTDQPLAIEFEVEFPDVSSQVGSRRLVPLAVLQQGSGNPFRHEKRQFPVYYSFPFQEVDYVNLELPDGYEVETLPAPRRLEPGFGLYATKWEKDGKRVALTRQFAVSGFFFKVEHYPSLREFYAQVATGDEDNVVFKAKSLRAK